MRQTTLTLIALIFLALISAAALAHPPGAVHGFYDLGRQELNVTVQHPVSKPKKHFVGQVVVYKNGSEVARKTFDFQTSRRNQTMPPFRIPAQVGDSFRIIAQCNQTGTIDGTIEVVDDAPDVRKLN